MKDGTIVFDVGGESRSYRLDLNAMCEFEDMTGKSLLNGFEGQMAVKDIRALLYVGLKACDSSITIEQVGGWIHGGNLESITTTIMESVGGEQSEGGGDPLAGSTSGQ